MSVLSSPPYIREKLLYPRRCKAAVIPAWAPSTWHHCNAPATHGIRTTTQDTASPRCEAHMPAELKKDEAA